MESLQEKVLDKLLKEMNEKHTPSEDKIHNWLCLQEDEALLKGILVEGKSVKGSLKYCFSKANEFKNGNVAIIDDETVYGWVREYFINEKVEIKEVTAAVSETKEVPEVKKKKKRKVKKEITVIKTKKEKEDGQINLFDFLDE